MGWSLSIGKIFGINLRIHMTFFLLLVFIFASVYHEHGINEAMLAVFFICAVFACVVIHEVGHSLFAKRFGKTPKSITLLPIGGIAAIEEMPDKPMQEVMMAIVGPIINLVIAGIIYAIVGRWTGIGFPNLFPDSAQSFFAGLIGINIVLAIFNLTPAFPMDGGRVLRGILAIRMEYLKATAVAVIIGQSISIFFIFFGLFYNWWLALIGIFLYIGAGNERHQVILHSLLNKVPVSEAMATEFHVLRPDAPLSEALEHFHHGCHQDFPVIGDFGLEGILTRDRILASIHEKGLNVPVSQVMDRDFATVQPDSSLDNVYKTLLAKSKNAVAVVDGGQVKGIVCMDDLSRYFVIRAAMQKVEI
jgi:Zn-dependent protease/CBS domain-containing protein